MNAVRLKFLLKFTLGKMIFKLFSMEEEFPPVNESGSPLSDYPAELWLEESHEK